MGVFGAQQQQQEQASLLQTHCSGKEGHPISRKEPKHDLRIRQPHAFGARVGNKAAGENRIAETDASSMQPAEIWSTCCTNLCLSHTLRARMQIRIYQDTTWFLTLYLNKSSVKAQKRN
jgi:hypothetical protein